MPTVRLSPDLEMHYRVDDFTDPWTSPETILLLHGNAESGASWYRWVPVLKLVTLAVGVALLGRSLPTLPLFASFAASGALLLLYVVAALNLGILSPQERALVLGHLRSPLASLRRGVVGASPPLSEPDDHRRLDRRARVRLARLRLCGLPARARGPPFRASLDI